MFDQSAAFYDSIYARLKDYPKEAAELADRIRREQPAAQRLLDVACGTGQHARLLAATHGFGVDGLDLDPRLLEIARARHPEGSFVIGDMTSFDLGRRYDAVLCLFGSIAYVLTLARLRLALERFRMHVEDGGVVVVDPFLAPEDLRPGVTHTLTLDVDGVRVTRSTRSEVTGRHFRLFFDYEFAGDGGVRKATELHELGLFTVTEMLDAFHGAGLAARYEQGGPSGRGLYVARAR